MSDSRRDFIKKACLGGACLCGFGGVLGSVEAIASTTTNDNPEPNAMHLNWIKEVLKNIETQDEETQRSILKFASKAHFVDLKMDEILAPYIGKLDEFIDYISKEWGWIFTYENNKRVILADENKSYCVCPLLKNEQDNKFPAICYCSEGFAETMFSKVIGKPVKATVAKSVQRGDNTCIYRIEQLQS